MSFTRRASPARDCRKPSLGLACRRAPNACRTPPSRLSLQEQQQQPAATPAVPFQLPGLLKERMERCRALLADPSSEYHGSADLKVFVQSADLIAAMHEVALDDRGQARTGLTLREELQAG